MFVVGHTASTNFPLGPSPLDPTHNGAADAFAVRLDATGTTILDGTFYGGASDDFVLGMGLSSTNQLWLVGSTNSANYPTSLRGVQVLGLGPFSSADERARSRLDDRRGFITSLVLNSMSWQLCGKGRIIEVVRHEEGLEWSGAGRRAWDRFAWAAARYYASRFTDQASSGVVDGGPFSTLT
ncbi:MAG: hypothetical protein IPH13_00465 [Planctomycetes bacterium]|nr:hypothetical protein [Planctomycetota bacterium]